LSDTGGPAIGVYNAQDRMLSFKDATYTYTASGSLLAKQKGSETTGYAYDEMGNLREAQLPTGRTIGYVIDGLNRRIGRKVDGQLTQGWLYLDRLRPIAELDGAGNVVATFVYASGSNVPAYMVRSQGLPDAGTYRLVTDHLGSVKLVVNVTTGVIKQMTNYDVWSNITSRQTRLVDGTWTEGDTDPPFQPFGFAGGLYDGDTKLVRFGARDYDPEVGRWTAKDPIRFAGGDANFYAYCGNDPNNCRDPDGLLGWVPSWIQRLGDWLGRAWDKLKDLTSTAWDKSQEIGRKVIEGARDLGQRIGDFFGGRSPVDSCKVTFSEAQGHLGHGARHLSGTGLDLGAVENAITKTVQDTVQRASSVGPFWGWVDVGGQTIIYRAYPLADGVVNIGTYYPK
jgi:RHS repeat-associated protein